MVSSFGRAALSAAVFALTAGPSAGVARAPRLRAPRREKYPGQRWAYLVGAHAELSLAQIADHNAEVSRRKDAARLERAARDAREAARS